VSGEEALGKAYDIRLMKRLWRFVRPHGGLLLLAFILIPTTIGFELAQPYLLKLAILDIQLHNLDGLGTIALLYVGFVGLQATSSFGEQYALNLLGQRSMHGMRLAIYDHVLRQRSAFFDRMPVGRLMTRMTNDIESINEMFASGVVTLVADVVKMTIIVVIMLSMDVRLTLMTFVTAPLLILLINWARHAMRTSFREIRVRLAAMNAYVSEHLSGIAVIQLFGREQAARREYDEINAAHRDAYLLSIQADAAMYALVEAIAILAFACVAWYIARYMGVDDTAGGAAQVALAVAFIAYIEKFFNPVRDLSAKYAVMQGAMAAMERINELLAHDEPDCPPRSDSAAASAAPASREAASPQAAVPERAALAAPAAGALDNGRPFRAAAAPNAPALVTFRDVVFQYERGEPVLRGVDLEVARGATVAVVGATGSGKTTLMKLLTRLYEPQAGAVLVDGRDVRDLPADALRRRVTVVSQDVFLFAGTIADNVRLGRADASRELVDDVLRRVGADRMLARRGATADAVVSEKGANFSAGERQLIAFARALARDPEILVLDEATAHVDPEAEAWIERGVAELMRGRTTLVIAHRLSTIRNADEIAVMVRGQIVERGNHDALLAAGGVYAALERTFRRKD
jgi:ATP-binding cassette subfamily B protein